MVTEYVSPTHFRLMMLGRHIQKWVPNVDTNHCCIHSLDDLSLLVDVFTHWRHLKYSAPSEVDRFESFNFDSFGHTSTHFCLMIDGGHSKNDLSLHAGSPIHSIWGSRHSSDGTVCHRRMGSGSLGDSVKNGYGSLFARMDTTLGQWLGHIHSDCQRMTTTLEQCVERIHFFRRPLKWSETISKRLVALQL